MPIGLVGRKCGMTRIFTKTGDSIPVTVIEALPNRVSQIKTNDTDGYDAIQVTFGKKNPNKLTKSSLGHFSKSGIEPGEGLWEFRLETNNEKEIELGSDLKVDIFESGEKIDVTGTSKGKGFAGGVKRHNFKTQDATHGNSLAHRAPGSIGQNQTPGRVFKGKKMAGQMGNVRRTVSNLEIIKNDKKKNLLMIKGGVPGAPGGYLLVRSSQRGKVS